MEDRCTCLHDPRVSSHPPFVWWLRHHALRLPKFDCDVHVDDYDQFYHAMLYYGHPFGKDVTMESFDEFYDMISGREKTSTRGDSTNHVVSANDS